MATPRGQDYRRVSFYVGTGGQQGEDTHLLPDPTESGGYFPPAWSSSVPTRNPHGHLPVYSTIHRIRDDIQDAIDDPYSLEQLKDPRMNVAVVRPLVDKYYNLKDISVVYCLLVNRTQFLKEHSGAPHHQSVNITRALLCELVANRILRRYSEANHGLDGLLLLANILVAGFDCFQGAPSDVLAETNQAAYWITQKRRGQERALPALEVAIISEAKTFLASTACQQVVRAIYEGRVIYTPSSFIDILPDHYKQKPISLYDPGKAPLFNQYRLIVPRTRNIIEVFQFIILLILYVLVMSNRDPGPASGTEMFFMVYTLGWVLEQFATILEHGWSVYTQNLWSFLDVFFTAIYIIYAIMRLHAMRVNDLEISRQALDILALGAPVLIPRLAFNLMSENMLFVSLRSMMADFALLTALAAWCFTGFLLSMMWLGEGKHETVTISKWMLWVWFGLDGTGIQRSVELHWVLGPVLMITFAFLGNTLFLTILVSMLTNTFAGIVHNASAEIQFRRAVLTLEGVKSDAIFFYHPPFNIAALCILLPLQYVVSPRWFHKINVAIVKILNAPLLLTIGLIERKILWSGWDSLLFRVESQFQANLQKPARRNFLWKYSRGFFVHGDIAAVFESDPMPEVHNEGGDVNLPATEAMVEEENEESGSPLSPRTPKSDRPPNSRTESERQSRSRIKRRDSMAPLGSLKLQLNDMLNDLVIEEDEELGTSGKGTLTRLDRLEGSVKRIESMLEKLCGGRLDDISPGRKVAGIVPLEDGDMTLQAERHE